MPEKYNEFIEGISKLFPIVFAAVTAKVLIEVKNKKASILGSLISLFVGLSVTYLVNPYVEITFPKKYYVITIGLVAILSDKIIQFIVFQFDIGIYLQAFLDYTISKIKKF